MNISTFLATRRKCKTAKDLCVALGVTPCPGDEHIPASETNFSFFLDRQAKTVTRHVEEVAKITATGERKLPCLANNPKIKYFGQQNTTALNIIEQLSAPPPCSMAISAQAGQGKTYSAGAALVELVPKFRNSWMFGPLVIWFTKANAIFQTQEVLYNQFGLKPSEVLVMNYEVLHSMEGKSQYIQEEAIILNGQPKIITKWRPTGTPALMVCDESHTVVNPEASITQKIMAYMMTPYARLLCLSATPASKGIDFGVYFIGYEYEDIANKMQS